METQRATARTVLVVDDYGDTRRVVRWMLEQKGYHVVEATNGQEAVETAVRERPDLILMDLSLPVLDGFDAVRQARAHEELRRVPVVAFTAHDTADFRDRAAAAGCDHYLTKPIDFQRLGVLLEKLLGR